MVKIMEKANINTECTGTNQAKPVILDLTGLKCPLPVLKVRRQISQMPAGAVLVVMADDPASPLDFDHFCQTGGHQLLDSAEKDGIYTMCISKAAD